MCLEYVGAYTPRKPLSSICVVEGSGQSAIYALARQDNLRGTGLGGYITGLLQGCYRVITGLLQGYYRVITGLLQGYYRVITGLLQGYYRAITGLLQCYYRWM